MRRPAALVAAVALAAIVPANAQSLVIKTHWIETAHAWHDPATMHFYVRRIEVTKTSWRAWVGFTNRTNRTLDVKVGQAGQSHSPAPFKYREYFDGPGLQWTKFIKGATALTARSSSWRSRPGSCSRRIPRPSNRGRARSGSSAAS